MCLQEALLDDCPPKPQNGERVDLATLMRASRRVRWTLRTTNAYFYWVTREQGSFDWFKGVMNEVAELDQRVSLQILLELLIRRAHLSVLAHLNGIELGRN